MIKTTAGAIALACAATVATAAHAQDTSAQDIARRAIERRAVEAAIWGMPLVSLDAMRDAFFKNAGARYGDILYFSKPADWKFQTTTPNSSSLYIYFNFNTKDGPVVLDFPAAAGAGLFGSILDAWQVPMADVGPAGEDHGKGGKYLLLPPDFQGSVPDGYIPIRSRTYNGYGLFRAIPAGGSAADLKTAIDLVKTMRLQPLAQAAGQPATRFIDISGKLFDDIVRFDDTFYDRLARMVEEEPVQTRDMVAMAQLRSLGIEKGKPFNPPPATRELLKKAANTAHVDFMHGLSVGSSFWPNSQWILSFPNGPKTGFTYELPDRLEIDERARLFFLAYAVPKKLGSATFYTAAYRDAQGQPLRGDKTYRLRVPPGVPVRQYWAVNVYDLDTAAFFREAPRLSVDSYDAKVQKNADGSVDVYFGPNAPAGKTSNWVYTAPGKPWFSMFRFYGPEKAVFDKTWVLGEIEQLDGNPR